MAFYQFEKQQKLPSDISSVWDFISKPANLKEITPPYMDFTESSDSKGQKMYPGMIITYRVSPFWGIKLTWVTEITHINEPFYFVDQQRIGPYSFWHHQHKIEPVEGGVLMTDIVTYQPPLGFLGAIANYLFIRKQLEDIFDYRFAAMQKKFGIY